MIKVEIISNNQAKSLNPLGPEPPQKEQQSYYSNFKKDPEIVQQEYLFNLYNWQTAEKNRKVYNISINDSAIGMIVEADVVGDNCSIGTISVSMQKNQNIIFILPKKYTFINTGDYYSIAKEGESFIISKSTTDSISIHKLSVNRRILIPIKYYYEDNNIIGKYLVEMIDSDVLKITKIDG